MGGARGWMLVRTETGGAMAVAKGGSGARLTATAAPSGMTGGTANIATGWEEAKQTEQIAQSPWCRYGEGDVGCPVSSAVSV